MEIGHGRSLRETLLLRQPRLHLGNHRQRGKRAGTGAAAYEPVHEFDAAPKPLTVEWLCQAAQQGDLLAKDIISGVGANIGRILAIMVNLFNPQKY